MIIPHRFRERHCAALDRVLVSFEIDAPGLIPDKTAVFPIQRYVAVDMDQRRPPAVTK